LVYNISFRVYRVTLRVHPMAPLILIFDPSPLCFNKDFGKLNIFSHLQYCYFIFIRLRKLGQVWYTSTQSWTNTSQSWTDTYPILSKICRPTYFSRAQKHIHTTNQLNSKRPTTSPSPTIISICIYIAWPWDIGKWFILGLLYYYI